MNQALHLIGKWLVKYGNLIAFTVLLLVVIFLWMAWGLFGVQIFASWICRINSNCGELGQVGDIFGGINALFSAVALGLVALSTGMALRVNAEDRQQARESEFLSQLKRSYEWAYAALTEDGKHIPPQPNRLNWLTAARHLVRCERLSQKLKSETYLLLNEEIKEYWRHRFRVAISHTSLRNRRYFGGDIARSSLDLTSALVVVKFAGWDATQKDPVDDIDQADLIDKLLPRDGDAHRGLDAWISSIPYLAQERDERKAKRERS